MAVASPSRIWRRIVRTPVDESKTFMSRPGFSKWQTKPGCEKIYHDFPLRTSLFYSERGNFVGDGVGGEGQPPAFCRWKTPPTRIKLALAYQNHQHHPDTVQLFASRGRRWLSVTPKNIPGFWIFRVNHNWLRVGFRSQVELWFFGNICPDWATCNLLRPWIAQSVHLHAAWQLWCVLVWYFPGRWMWIRGPKKICKVFGNYWPPKSMPCALFSEGVFSRLDKDAGFEFSIFIKFF